MSYIRTKDGIHSVEAVPLSNGRIRYSLSNEDSLISKEDFEKITIREADTIEELCDMFILDETHYMDTSLQEIMLYEKCIGKGLITTIYGCIWTDKGLIYVAKMDSDGKLVLI